MNPYAVLSKTEIPRSLLPRLSGQEFVGLTLGLLKGKRVCVTVTRRHACLPREYVQLLTQSFTTLSMYYYVKKSLAREHTCMWLCVMA